MPVASQVIWKVPAVVEKSAPKSTQPITGSVDAAPAVSFQMTALRAVIVDEGQVVLAALRRIWSVAVS
jgi:hypothetical protein